MKKNVFLLLLVSLAIPACQNDKAPVAKTPVELATASSASMASDAVPVQSKQQVVEQYKAETTPANDTVAVTKPVVTHAAQSLGTAMQETGDKIKGELEAMKPVVITSNKPDIAKAVSAQGLADQHPGVTPAAIKTIATEKIQTVSTSTAPVQKQATAVKAATAQKAVLASHPAVPSVSDISTTPAGDAAKGKSLAKKCAACHNFTAKKKLGPGLKGIVGRKAGIMPDMKYSADLASGGWIWTAKNIAMWDCDSKKAIKVLSGNPAAKTRMSSQRICDPQKQADLITFLKTL